MYPTIWLFFTKHISCFWASDILFFLLFFGCIKQESGYGYGAYRRGSSEALKGRSWHMEAMGDLEEDM